MPHFFFALHSAKPIPKQHSTPFRNQIFVCYNDRMLSVLKVKVSSVKWSKPDLLHSYKWSAGLWFCLAAPFENFQTIDGKKYNFGNLFGHFFQFYRPKLFFTVRLFSSLCLTFTLVWFSVNYASKLSHQTVINADFHSIYFFRKFGFAILIDIWSEKHQHFLHENVNDSIRSDGSFLMPLPRLERWEKKTISDTIP